MIIENVGNLVCPAEFDVGEHAKAMVYSVTEGEDKPLKYPVMFRSVDVVLLNKIDLVPHLDADVDTYIAHVRQVNPTATIFPVSARTGRRDDRVVRVDPAGSPARPPDAASPLKLTRSQTISLSSLSVSRSIRSGR